MIGRLVGAYAMLRTRPATLLMLAAFGAAILAIVATAVEGSAGGVLLIDVGLCNSTMYPTIYVLCPTNRNSRRRVAPC